jgi:hypothetical protein
MRPKVIEWPTHRRIIDFAIDVYLFRDSCDRIQIEFKAGQRLYASNHPNERLRRQAGIVAATRALWSQRYSAAAAFESRDGQIRFFLSVETCVREQLGVIASAMSVFR